MTKITASICHGKVLTTDENCGGTKPPFLAVLSRSGQSGTNSAHSPAKPHGCWVFLSRFYRDKAGQAPLSRCPGLFISGTGGTRMKPKGRSGLQKSVRVMMSRVRMIHDINMEVMMKKCRTCGVEKDESEFSKRSPDKQGRVYLRSDCKDCCKRGLEELRKKPDQQVKEKVRRAGYQRKRMAELHRLAELGRQYEAILKGQQ